MPHQKLWGKDPESDGANIRSSQAKRPRRKC